MSNGKRWIGWILAGGVTVVATVHTYRQERQASPVPGQPIARKGGEAASYDSVATMLDRLRRERLSGDVVGAPFAGRVAGNATAAPAVPAGPPPFPYRYAGQFSLADGGNRVYLSKDNVLVHLREGEVLEGGFKVTEVGEEKVLVLHVSSGKALELQYSSLRDDLRVNAALAQTPSADMPLQSSSAAPMPGEARRAEPVARLANMGPGARPSASAAIATGATPTGTLGIAGRAQGSAPLGVAAPATGSMPKLPAPSGRLGV